VTPSQQRTLDELAQGLRKAHCSRDGDELHECVGICTITRTGVQLDCKLCGNDSQLIAPSVLLIETTIAKRVLAAVGLEWHALTPERKRAAVDAVRKTLER
jgi:hypothetical protein